MPITKLPKTEIGKPRPSKQRRAHQGKGTLKPLWNLYEDGVTQGAINLFLSCREQFRLAMLEGLSPRAASPAIEFGSAFHECLAAIQSQQLDPALAVRRYERKKRKLSLTSSELEGLEIQLGQVQILLEIYGDYWRDQDKAKRWLKREETFRVPVQVGTWPIQVYFNGIESAEIPLRGRWDGIFEQPYSTAKSNATKSDGKDGKAGKVPSETWILETKTKGNIDKDGIQDSLPFDTQTMLYSYAAEVALGRKIAGTVYDVIRRPGLKQGKDTMPVFLARVRKDIEARLDWYFMRWQVTLAASDINRWYSDQLTPILRQMLLWYTSLTRDEATLASPWKSPFHFMTPGSLFTRWGRADMFEAITHSNYYKLYRRKVAFPELVD